MMQHLTAPIGRGLERLLARAFGRLPIGWLQLSHSRTRLAAALAGVAFANVLVFVQLGIMGSLNGSVAMTYGPLRGDLLVSSTDGRTLTDGSPLARRLLWVALSEPGVAAAAPVYLGKLDWRRADGSAAQLTVYGMPVDAARFAGPLLADRLARLSPRDTVLLDARTRGVDPVSLAGVSPDTPLTFEANGRTLDAIGTVSLGGGFSADGALLASDQTFFRLFPTRSSATPSHLLVDVADGTDHAEVARRLDARLAGQGVVVRTMEEAMRADLRYQTTQRPTGVIFGFGVLIGAIVGIVIVYQVLSTDVADHLREYATFNAMGYPHRFFLGIVLEEALVLAVLGFVPGVLLSMAIYAGMSHATGLPVHMDALRAIGVLLGTIAACLLSGALATRRLRAADPAELF
jgi:putative ABC transport system permease protein